MSIREFIKSIPEEWRIKAISGTTMLYNFANAFVKIFFGVFSVLSPAFISGLYSLCVGVAKQFYFVGKKRSYSLIVHEIKYFKAIGITLIFAAAFFLFYVVIQMVFSIAPKRYGFLALIVIVCVSVVELILALAGIAHARKENDMLAEGLKCVNLVSSFNAIVTAETAVLTIIFNGMFARYSGIFALFLAVNALWTGFYIVHKAANPWERGLRAWCINR